MCGIVGVVDFDRPTASDTLIAMRDALAHRGPDGAGLWQSQDDGPWCGLGHRRLAILDLSPAGHQPMLTPDGRFVIAFNGEVYNYRELQTELEACGYRFRGGSDTEVVLAAFATWGAESIRRFNGMWALAIWDTHERQLFLSRDRLGKKPLYYWHDGRRFAFASEMKALVRHPEIPCRIHGERLDAYIRNGSLPTTEASLLDGIQQLPPAHHLCLKASGDVQRRRYWQIDTVGPDSGVSEDAYVERFQALLDDAIRLRLRADVPVGSSLSGGLDSSLIVRSIAAIRSESGYSAPQRTFTARFPSQPHFDEGLFVDAVTQGIAVEPHAIEPTAEAMIAACESLHLHQEEPVQSTSIFAQWEVMRLARQHQTKVLLDGQGADELLAGYVPYVALRLLDLVRARRLSAAWQEYRQFTRRQREALHAVPGATLRTFELSAVSILTGAMRRLIRRVQQPPTSEVVASEPAGLSRLGRRLHRDTFQAHLPLLLRYADRNSMAHGVEVRNPFLDYRLVELAFELPDALKIQHGWTKYVERAAGSVLPDIVRWRADKVGFVTPEDHWLRGPLRPWAESQLFGPRLQQLAGYPLAHVSRCWQEHQTGKRNRRQQLWPWISLAQWLELLESGRFQSAPVQPPRAPVRRAA